MIRAIARSGGFTLAALVAYFALPLDRSFGWLLAIGVLVGLLGFLVPLTVRHARRLSTSAAPMRDAAESLVSLLVLLIVGFATVHYTIAASGPGEYDGLETKVDGLYYSMSVISTVGFGDVRAVDQLPRLVVTVQMLFDLLFIGLAVQLLTKVARDRAEQVGLGGP